MRRPMTSHIEARRAVVADGMFQGMTLDQITDHVHKAKIINRKTGKPFSRWSVWRDMVALIEQWKEDAKEAIDTLRGRQFAELQAIKAQAWKDKDWGTVLAAIDREMRLVGTQAPQRIDVAVIRKEAERLAERHGLDPSTIMADAERIAASGRFIGGGGIGDGNGNGNGNGGNGRNGLNGR